MTGNDQLLESLTGIFNIPASSRPQVVSYSFSFGDSDFQYQATDNNGQTENVLLQLASVGVTVIASAGDDGAPSSTNTNCAAASSQQHHATNQCNNRPSHSHES